METRWLEDFVVLARTRHFSRAAELSNVSQPTFSRRIKLLEEEIGAPLINRQSLPLSLTPAGEEFLVLCEQIQERLRLTRERIRAIDAGAERRVLLAAPHSLLVHFVDEWSRRHQVHDRLTPYLRATGWLIRDYFDALERGECELALCYWPTRRIEPPLDLDAFDSVVVGSERLLPLSAPDPQGAPRFRLPGERRRPLPHIAFHPRGLLDATLRAHLGEQPQPPFLTTLSESIQAVNILELVKGGYGLGWLPARTARAALASGELVAAGQRDWEVPLELRLFRARRPRTDALEALWAEISTR